MQIRKAIAKHLLFPVENFRNQLAAHLKHLETSQWLSPAQIQKMQWEKLKKLIHHAYSNIPYYHELFDAHGIKPTDINSFDDFAIIPPLQKKMIQQHSDRMLADTLDKKNLMRKITSGSTGEPVAILQDRRTETLAAANGWRFRRWAEVDIGDEVARIWGRAIDVSETVTPKNVSSILSANWLKMKIRGILSDFIQPTLILSAFEPMTEKAMWNFFMALKQKKIITLIGYVSVVYFFAEYVNNNHLDEIKLKSVITVSEVLYEHQRQSIEKAFQCRVFNFYGAREVGLIASECKQHQGLHINAENLYVEVLNAAGRPVSDGELGEIAVTDLSNYAMPLLRYLIGDHAVLSGRVCPCERGLPLIKQVIGRVADMIALPDGNFLHGTIFVNFMWNFTEEVERFRLEQHTKGEADLYLKLRKAFTTRRLQLLQNSLQDSMFNNLTIRYHIVDELPVGSDGKFKYVVSDIQA